MQWCHIPFIWCVDFRTFLQHVGYDLFRSPADCNVKWRLALVVRCVCLRHDREDIGR